MCGDQKQNKREPGHLATWLAMCWLPKLPRPYRRAALACLRVNHHITFRFSEIIPCFFCCFNQNDAENDSFFLGFPSSQLYLDGANGFEMQNFAHAEEVLRILILSPAQHE